MARMAQLYHLGSGTAQDDAEAYLWFGMAQHANGDRNYSARVAREAL